MTYYKETAFCALAEFERTMRASFGLRDPANRQHFQLVLRDLMSKYERSAVPPGGG